MHPCREVHPTPILEFALYPSFSFGFIISFLHPHRCSRLTQPFSPRATYVLITGHPPLLSSLCWSQQAGYAGIHVHLWIARLGQGTSAR
jgi:hypothetical protein